jgi:hypothetical protein
MNIFDSAPPNEQRMSISIYPRKAVLAFLLILAPLISLSGQIPTVTKLTTFSATNSNSRGSPGMAIHGDYAFMLYTDANSKGRVTRYNMNTGVTDYSAPIWDTIAVEDAGHNGHAIAIDGDGYIHTWLSMHNHPMNYYRSIAPHDQLDYTVFDVDDFSGNLGPEMPLDGKHELVYGETERFTYPWACTSTNGDVFVILRINGPSSQTNEKQYFYHWDNENDTWDLEILKAQPGKNAYMSFLNADDQNNVHIVTAWSQKHSGDNTFQRASYVRYDVTNDAYYTARGNAITSLPLEIDGPEIDLPYPGEQPWADPTCEIQTPRVTLDETGKPIVTFAYNTNNYSQTNPIYRVDVTQWDGTQWVRTENIQPSIINHGKTAITYTGGWINTFTRRTSSGSWWVGSNDNGQSYTGSMVLSGNTGPVNALNISPDTDIMIDRMSLYEVTYPTSNISISAPIVEIDSPEEGDGFDVSADIVITAAASDSDGTIAQVEFFVGNTSLGIDTTSPYSVTWENVAGGYYTLTAVATDDASVPNSSKPVNIVVGNPVVVTETVLMATDDAELNQSNPDSTNNWSTIALRGESQPGLFKFVIPELDGHVTNATLRLHTNEVVAAPNTASIHKTNGSEWEEGTVTWNTAPAKGDFVTDITFTELGWHEVNVTSYVREMVDESAVTFWIEGNTSDRVKIDNHGKDTGPELVITTAFGNVPPSVQLTAPSNDSVFDLGRKINITAEASDEDGAVAQVEFFVGPTSLGVDTSRPFIVFWTPELAGNYSLTAVATDDEDATGESIEIDIVVQETDTSIGAEYILFEHDFVDQTLGGMASITTTGSEDWFATNWKDVEWFAELKPTGPVEAWLITPELDLEIVDTPTIVFHSLSALATPDLELLISTDYEDGQDPTQAIWTPLGFDLPLPGWAPLTTTPVDLSAYDERVHLAFRIATDNGMGSDGWWQVSNIIVAGTINEKTKFTKTHIVEDFLDGTLGELISTQGSSDANINDWVATNFKERSYFAQTGGENADDWLLTPILDMSQTDKPILSFASMILDGDFPFKAKVSTDYDGTNLETATWTVLDAKYSTGEWEYIQSGNISLAEHVSATTTIGFHLMLDGVTANTCQLLEVYVGSRDAKPLLDGLPGVPDTFDGLSDTEDPRLMLADWLGWYYKIDMQYMYYLYHLGWVHAYTPSIYSDDIYMYSLELEAWFFTNKQFYPYAWDFTLGAWVTLE